MKRGPTTCRAKRYITTFKAVDVGWKAGTCFDSLANRLWSKDFKHLIPILVRPGLQGKNACTTFTPFINMKPLN